MKILIYDNEWAEFLKVLPYELVFAKDEDDVYEKTFHQKFDFYIFDFANGYKVLNELREGGDNTIAIFLSDLETFDAQKKSYKIADDFFKKSSTYIEEIKIKIDYFIKKFFHLDDIIKYKELYFNRRLRVVYKEGKKIELTNLEYDLLILFFRNQNKYLSKEFIIDNLEVTEGSLKVKISNLRKIGFDIENKKEIGYKIKEMK